jgi:imidazolonepropionase-like amidohydrolase
MVMRALFVRGSAALLFAVALSTPSTLMAQFLEAPPPPAYALQNLTVVSADGSQESGVTVVVRNGLIEGMGTDVTVPGDALLLDGDSLYLYPGLVDAHGSADFSFPEIERPEDMQSWDAPRAVQGLLAHRRVVDYLTATGESGEDMRKKGVVAAGILPDGALASGQGAAVIFRSGTDNPWDLVANPGLGLSMSFRGAQGAYPSQLFGVIAYIRQAFEDANRMGVWQAAYASNPEGVTMPKYDADYQTLNTVAAGQMPVYFVADRAEDIRRVMMLSEEYGFRPIIVGGTEAWKVADHLAAARIPVLIDADFKAPSKWKPDAEDQMDLEPAAQREKESLEEAYSNAAVLSRAGVAFALTSGGGDGELREGARKAIEYGLSSDDALAAITTTPAAMLGMPNLVRVGEGMAATFVVMDKPIFEEGSNINYTFVEGDLERGRAPGATPDAGGPAAMVSGTWSMSMDAAGQEFSFDMVLTQEGSSLSGSAEIPDAGTAAISGTVSGNTVDFVMSLDAGGQTINLEASGTIDGTNMSGSGSSPFGEFTFTGTKQPGAER